MRYLALLKDSLVETLDRKSLYVALSLSVLLILLCASIGFREMNDAEMLNRSVNDFGTVFKAGAADVEVRHFKTKFEIVDPVFEGKEHRFQLRVSPVDSFHRAVHTWSAIQKGKSKKESDPVEGIEGDKVADPGEEQEIRFLRAQFRQNFIPRADIEALPGPPDVRLYRVEARIPRSGVIAGGHEISFLFGAFSVRLGMPQAVLLLVIEIGVADWIGGFVGVMLAVIFTAGFIPGMLQKGTLDLILAKPVRRWAILLTKYVGGLFYVAIPATVLIGGCWLAISWRSGYFNFGFLTSIGVLILIFAVLYSFAVLMGLLTRNTIATIFLTIALWFGSFMIGQTPKLVAGMGIPMSPGVVKGFERVRLVLPRTHELSQVSNYYIIMGNIGAEIETVLEGRTSEDLPSPKWKSLLLSSVGFIAGMLGLACWIFSRRDY